MIRFNKFGDVLLSIVILTAFLSCTFVNFEHQLNAQKCTFFALAIFYRCTHLHEDRNTASVLASEPPLNDMIVPPDRT